MIANVRYWTRRFYSILNISKTKTMNVEKCYFRYVEEEEKIDLTFLYKIKESMRQFNLSRKPTEKLQTLFVRIQTNISKVVNKSNKKKKNSEPTNIEVKLCNFDTGISEDCTCKDLFDIKGSVKLQIHETIYEAVFNAPWVLSIGLPYSILAGYPVYPDHFETHNADKTKSIYNWYTGLATNDKGNALSEEHIKWELVGDAYNYIPNPIDVGKKLKLECTPSNEITLGPTVETISKNVVEAGPGMCPFETRHMFTTDKLKGQRFRCVTYNILADLYCDSDHTRTVLHPYCPPYALHIDYRKQLIIKELLGYNADIICLQEVDSKIFNHFLGPILNVEGFNGFFYKKGKEVAEGLACFYRKERFRCLGENKIVLSEALQNEPCLEPIWNSIKNNDPLVSRVLNRSTAASATFLQSVDNDNEIIIVANTHLYFHPDADHIRLIQGGIVIYWLTNVRNVLQEQHPNKRISLIFCGDFNSVPSCGIYQLYTTGLAHSDLPDWKSNANEAVKNVSLRQGFRLDSACGTPKYTNFTDGFADCLDYIFYDTYSLCVEQVVPFPSDEEFKLHTALPSIVFPSDHVALIADLKWL